MTMAMDKQTLTKTLAEFFLDSLRQDAEDVANWCEQSGDNVDDIVADIEKHLAMKI